MRLRTTAIDVTVCVGELDNHAAYSEHNVLPGEQQHH